MILEEMEFRPLQLDGYEVDPGKQDEATVMLPEGKMAEPLFESFMGSVLFEMEERQYLPIARFCDGEYAFYAGREVETCWGEKAKMEGHEFRHIDALRLISRKGYLCPNLSKAWEPQWRPFLEWLDRHGILLQRYAPFYFVYAMLGHSTFLKALRGKRVGLISSFANKDLRGLTHVFQHEIGAKSVDLCPLPASGVAHGEFEVEFYFAPDIVFVGAGIGAPLVLAELEPLGCVCIDAGFLFHIWDGSRSKRERLFLDYQKG